MQTDGEQVAGLRALQKALYLRAGGMRPPIVLDLGDTPELHIEMLDCVLQVCHATDPGLYDLWLQSLPPAESSLEMLRPGLSLEQTVDFISGLTQHRQHLAHLRKEAK